MQEVIIQENKRRRPFLAAVLSLILPGLGHVYAGNLTKGLSFIGLPFVLILIAGKLEVLSTFYGISAFIVIFVVIYITAFISAIKLALKNNQYQLQSYNRWYWYIAILILAPILTSIFLLPRGEKLGYETYNIPSQSMQPTLQVGDLITVNTRNQRPEVGDVIVFKYPQNREISYVKRVAAVGGDTVSIQNGILIRNGQTEHKLTIPEKQRQMQYSISMEKIQVPNNQIFFLGDARDNSSDSRIWGTVPIEDIIGKVTYIWFSKDLNRIGNPVK